jgi:hypothetical protein
MDSRSINPHAFIPMDRQNDLRIFAVCLYIGFCVSAFLIPDSVMFGESLCFAYTYAMVQVLGVALFTGGRYGVVCGAIFACVLPTAQILQALQNTYTAEIDNIYGELYMGKEILFYLNLRRSYVKKNGIDRHHADIMVSVCVFIWLLMHLMFWFIEPNRLYKTAQDKIFCIISLSPSFWMALINM